MKIEVQRGPKVYEDRPESVTIILVGDSGEAKAAVNIYASKINPDDKMLFIKKHGSIGTFIFI